MIYVVDSIDDSLIRLIGEDEIAVTVAADELDFKVSEGDVLNEYAGVFSPLDGEKEKRREENIELLKQLTEPD